MKYPKFIDIIIPLPFKMRPGSICLNHLQQNKQKWPRKKRFTMTTNQKYTNYNKVFYYSSKLLRKLKRQVTLT